MKILITAPFLKTRGVLHCIEALLPYLGDTDIINRGKQRSEESLIKTGLKQIWIYLKFIIKIIKNDYDTVLINTSIGYYTVVRDGIFVIIAKLFRKKTILYVHGYRKTVVDHKLLMAGYFLSDKIIVLAEELKEKLKLVGYKKDIYIMYNPVDISIIETEYREKPTDVINLLYLARLEKEKGIIIALEAYKIAKEKDQNIVFNIAGDGTHFEKLKLLSLAKNIKDVNILGFIVGQDKINLLNKSHILIAPTYREGLSIAILEAMTAGLAVVSRPVGGIKDFFQNGKMGYLIESTEPKEFSDGILNSINDLSTVSKYNYNFAGDNFHPGKIAGRLMEIINGYQK